jgi:hypothetical protein
VPEIKPVPRVPLSDPFVERLIETLGRECLDRTLFWTTADLKAKLLEKLQYSTVPWLLANLIACRGALMKFTALTTMVEPLLVSGQHSLQGCWARTTPSRPCAIAASSSKDSTPVSVKQKVLNGNIAHAAGDLHHIRNAGACTLKPGVVRSRSVRYPPW